MADKLKHKPSIVVVYTGEGKGKTSAGVGLVARALGTGWKVAFVQFIKHWDVGEHRFLNDIKAVYGDNLTFYKGGLGFYNAGGLSAPGVSEKEHKIAAKTTLDFALKASQSGEYQLVVCDEINNAVADKLLLTSALVSLITKRAPATNLCLTGRNYPKGLVAKADIVTEMKKIKHHYDDDYVANKGIDY